MCFNCVNARVKNGEHHHHLDYNEAGMMTESTQVQQAFTTATTYTDALIEEVTWTGSLGEAATIGYSFDKTTEGGTLFNSTQQTQVLDVMQLWANVANITFTERPVIGTLTFSQADLGPGTAGLASYFFVGTRITSTEVQIDDEVTDVSDATFGYLVLLHEVGHALGLKHPGAYGSFDVGPYLSTAEDTIETTVMSYNNGTNVNETINPPETPMIYDIAAIQEMYGANTSYMTGNDTYSFSGGSTVQTLWDAAGTDVINASSYSSGSARIDLNSGVDNLTQIGQSLIWIAFGATIENAVGTINGDTIIGNSSNNEMFGGNGVDSISAGSGDDTIYGGDAVADSDDSADTIAGGDGNDLAYGNSGNDTLYGGAASADSETGSDTLYGGSGSDDIYGNAGNDSLYGGGDQYNPNDDGDFIAGGKGLDYILSNGGNDTVYGGGSSVSPDDGADTIFGGGGADSLLGNGGNDSIVGGIDNDTMHGGQGDDIYYIGSGHGVDVILALDGAGSSGGDIIQLLSGVGGFTSAQAVADAATFSDGNAVIDFGGGHSITIGGISSLVADDFSIV